ncbi:MAG: signal peptidase II [Actinomycetota bacterium]
MKALPHQARWLYLTAALVIVVDRVTKMLAESLIAGEPSVRVLPGVYFTYTTNLGGAFGVFQNAAWLFAAAAVIVSAVIVVLSVRIKRTPLAIGLGLVLGGSLGNLVDRVVNGPWLSGRVVDFIDLRVWPVFNIGDAAIVVGAGIIIVAGIARKS